MVPIVRPAKADRQVVAPGPESCALHCADPVARINDAVDRLDWSCLRRVLAVPGNPGYRLCRATEADFETYVASEDQAFKSRYLALNDGFLFIVEIPSPLHSAIADAVNDLMKLATGTMVTHLESSGDAYVDTSHLPEDQRLSRLEPDGSFGPTDASGAILPATLTCWGEYQTIKVEVGVCEGWNHMDRKVLRYAAFTGIQYVLCIYVSPATASTAFMAVRQYKLCSFVHNVLEGPPPAAVAPIPITADTEVELDARRLLALPPHVRIPDGFNNTVVLRLNDALRRTWRSGNPDRTQVAAPF
ncbi:hypothetical protein SPRG_00211 [Saprolegnia parasitica CBS 223.65]|uniref:Uncharacterized protein n=1 Tax=Saprolegnia parasitica (strain CBS 223.65) TaxID=695850 RepID=A0A067D8M9_SAPPC|nr:hypothetical protein SPRG_00211 [Saprolegnia parasitica CBS 223.65]KDO35362.1 hypothetical protein SPRG_00211 [Saprolegnia parasitica CBS 223.65]|eukprot:XP_012193708.1 hypothetical protein SPRG_00211 [Saprolegnia parasitica CBS 223.65]